LPDDFREVIAMLEAGKFPVDMAVSTIVPMEEAPAVISRWSANPSLFTKIMVKIND
jgi:threonine dehydrogenase-like Zn-dependent dehydrogenase